MAGIEYNFSHFGLDGLMSSEIPRKFPKWRDLPAELQTTVVSYLDYTTRMCLAYSSKRDYEVVSSTPVKLAFIEIEDCKDDYFILAQDHTRVSIRIQFEDESGSIQFIYFYFIKRENDTELAWMDRSVGPRHNEKRIILKGCDYFKEALRFAERWFEKSKFNVKSISIELNRYPHQSLEIGFLSQCKGVSIVNEDESFLTWWLDRVPPELDFLRIAGGWNSIPLTEKFLSMDHFKKANAIRMFRTSEITDEIFLSMTAKHIVIEAQTISDRAINQFIRNWINGKVRDDFVLAIIWISRSFDKSEILKNVVSRPWDDGFVEESRDFTREWSRTVGRIDSMQISKGDGSGTTATLDLGFGRIAFGTTGRRHQLDGLIYSVYRVPELNYEQLQ